MTAPWSRALMAPDALLASPPLPWHSLLPRLHASGMLAHWSLQCDPDQLKAAPPAVQRQARAQETVAEAQRRSTLWEIAELGAALRAGGCIATLVKGADYIRRGARPGVGRRIADVDLLVSADDHAEIARVLQRHGWQPPPPQASGEPWVHADRGTLVDLHTSVLRIVPRGVRLDHEVLREDAVLRESVWLDLAPATLPIVTTAHYIRNRLPGSALRDLVDLVELMQDGDRTEAGFVDEVIRRGEAAGMARGLSRAVRDAHHLLGEAVPARAVAWARTVRPLSTGVPCTVMLPDGLEQPSRVRQAARALRARWLTGSWS